MNKLYMIGNTHFDPVWEWTWDEAMSSIRATFRSALDRMKEYPDFCYSFSSPPIFEWIKKTEPEMFSEIKERVSEGRWDVAEGWWNQPDCFSAMGESYVRQGLYGQRYLMENFGKYSECAFNTDSFGHPDMLPQILLKAGIKYYCLCRPEEHHYHLDSPLFRWKSKDGSEVKAFRIGSQAGEGWSKDVKKVMDEILTDNCDLLIVYGVTDHGGAPTKKAIEAIMENNSSRFSDVSGYFKAQKDIPITICDELITGDFGVYANHSGVKQMNRIAEYALLNAEKSCVIANEKHTTELTACWHDVLFNQFHDILGGASIKAAYTDARNLHGRAIQSANEILNYNLQKMTSKVKMPGKNSENIWNIVLWNLNDCAYNGYAEAEVQWAHEFDWYDKEIALEDADGNKVETQIIAEHAAIPRFRSRFIFKTSVPPMGYKAYKLIQTNEDIKPVCDAVPNYIETETFRYTLSKENGCISEVYDKKNRCVTARNLFVPACFEDLGDTWCFNIENYGKRIGEFSVIKAEIAESGDLTDDIRLTLKFQDSVLVLVYRFYKEEKYFDLSYTVNWNEEHIVFKFECETESKTLSVSTPYGQMQRETDLKDKPMGEWILTDEALFLTGSNFAYNFYDDKLGITVLCSPVYGDLRLGELPKKYNMIMEQGITGGRIRAMFNFAYPISEAMSFLNPPKVICESNHDGCLSACDSFFSLCAEKAAINAIKYAEDGDAIIIRISCTFDHTQSAVLTVFGKEYEIKLSAYEIKTLKYHKGELSEVNLLENELITE